MSTKQRSAWLFLAVLLFSLVLYFSVQVESAREWLMQADKDGCYDLTDLNNLEDEFQQLAEEHGDHIYKCKDGSVRIRPW